MAVYREGFMLVEFYEKNKRQIWNDACDEGLAVNKDDDRYRFMTQLAEWYGSKETRSKISTNQVVINFTLIDEWAVSDGRKSVEAATQNYELHFYKFRKNDLPSLRKRDKLYGFFNIVKL